MAGESEGGAATGVLDGSARGTSSVRTPDGSTVGAGTTAAVTGPRSEADRDQDNAFARDVAGKILDKKTTDLVRLADAGRKQVEDFTPGERALYARANLMDGWAKADYGKDGIAISYLNADASDVLTIKRPATGDFDVSTITGEKRDPPGDPEGRLTHYICKTPLGAVKEIPADELIDAHAQKNASAMFPDKDQAALIAWYAKKDKTDCPVESATVSLMDVAEESGAEVQFELEEFISKQIDALENELKELKNQTDREQVLALLRDCKIATYNNGDAGIFFKQHVMKSLQRHRRPQGDTGLQTANDIDGHLERIVTSGEYGKGTDALVAFLEKNLPEGKKDKRYDELIAMINKGDALSVLQQKDVSKMPGLNELVFGDPEMTNKLIDSLIGSQYLSHDAREALRKAGKNAGFSLLAFLLLVPALAFQTIEGISGIAAKNAR